MEFLDLKIDEFLVSYEEFAKLAKFALLLKVSKHSAEFQLE